MVINFPNRVAVFLMLLLVTTVTYAVSSQENSISTPESPRTSKLSLPLSEADNSEKKCITVCDEWGKDCIINPKTGQRKCRRMCKSFGQECL